MKLAKLVVSDAPYNVPIRGNVSGNGAIHHREFLEGSGEMDPSEFTSFLTTVFMLLSRYSVADSLHFLFMDWRHIGEMLAAGKQVYNSLLNVCVWVKNVGGMGSLYRSRDMSWYSFSEMAKENIAITFNSGNSAATEPTSGNIHRSTATRKLETKVIFLPYIRR